MRNLHQQPWVNDASISFLNLNEVAAAPLTSALILGWRFCFHWQGGYADFSVSQSNLDEVKADIASQEEHHRKLTFQEEVRALLRKHELQWDERYVWE
ncbi:MAG TPA: hypothetical protein VEC99_16530 [Clostridia bacterium]|nr:hypothetical protein [Clostridia bacterium]